jgi:hypothetical protein
MTCPMSKVHQPSRCIEGLYSHVTGVMPKSIAYATAGLVHNTQLKYGWLYCSKINDPRFYFVANGTIKENVRKQLA